MSLHDIVLDTNILMHAANPIETRFEAALELVRALIDATTVLCVDEGFSMIEALNRSLIGAEYLEKLVVGTPGYALITHMALEGRITFVKAAMTSADSKRLNQILANKRDRTFVKAAAASRDMVLVSHDYGDFPPQKRTIIKKLFGVSMPDAAGALPLVA